MKKVMFGMIASSALLLAACGGAEEEVATPEAEAPAATETAEAAAANAEIVAIIEARQDNLKEMGASMRAISESMRSGSPDATLISEKADIIAGHAATMGDWFPAGSGPEAGVETEALPTIWENPEGFAEAVSNFQTAAVAFQAAAASGDMTATGGALRSLGGTCGACHDDFRVDDD
ncbi:cytochrome c [Ponticaulis sp.]|uniref:c-type cytochrome n=1 Tax=Ponticaulis sp. TaxID=2020902 RepID=UPI0025E5A36F|nr:cytochrome c [Ponticaulis sp.]